MNTLKTKNLTTYLAIQINFILTGTLVKSILCMDTYIPCDDFGRPWWITSSGCSWFPPHKYKKRTHLLLSSWCVKTKVMPLPTKTPSSPARFYRSENNYDFILIIVIWSP